VIAMRPDPPVSATHNIIPIPAPKLGNARATNVSLTPTFRSKSCRVQRAAPSRITTIVNDGMSLGEIKRQYVRICMESDCDETELR
jgi:hypothetical protein